MLMFFFFFFFFNDTATTEIYTLSLHDALPIPQRSSSKLRRWHALSRGMSTAYVAHRARSEGTRLNSSHVEISYAVFCLKKKKKTKQVVITAHVKKVLRHTTA